MPAKLPADDSVEGEDRALDNAIVIESTTPWLEKARADLGLREIRGSEHEPRILKMFQTAGHPYVVDDETAWCAAAMCTWLEEAGISSPKTLAARGFLKWGREIDDPVPGCIVVMWRGSPEGWQGHVGIYLGDSPDGKHIRVLGGNQSNRVQISEYGKRRKWRGQWHDAVLSYRMPRRVLRTQVASAASAAASAGVAVVGAAGAAVSTAPPAVGIVRPVGDALIKTGSPTAAAVGLWLMVGLAVLGAAAGIYAAWRRGHDHRERGV